MSVEICVGRAHGFVAAQGTAFDLQFLETMLQERPAAELLASLAQLQDERGAIARTNSNSARADLASTARALGCLEALGLGDHPVPERACSYLCQLQDDEGAWAPTEAADEAERIRWTGRIGALLANTPFARLSVLRAAEAFLAKRWSVDRVQGPSYEPILAYTSLLTQVPSELADEALQWCGRELERGFRSQAFSPLATARVFLRARVRALPGASIEAAELLTGLVTTQRDDGSWAVEDDDPSLEATLEAVEALLRLS